MKIGNNSVNLNSYNIQRNFGASKPKTLFEIYRKHSFVIPQRVRKVVEKELLENVLSSKNLRDIHLEVYKPLLDCKTLDEARNLFPEFREVLDLTAFLKKKSQNIKKIEKVLPLEEFSLTMLKEKWGKCKTKDEIAQTLGLKDRSALGWFLDMIRMPNFDKNYQVVLNSCNKEKRELMAQKTRAYNLLHPDLMRAHNKNAAQALKKEDVRKKLSQNMKEYDVLHPQRREKIGRYSKAVWDLCPDVKNALREFSFNAKGYYRVIMAKRQAGTPLSDGEKRMLSSYYKEFWDSNPALKKQMEEARKLVSSLLKENKM